MPLDAPVTIATFLDSLLIIHHRHASCFVNSLSLRDRGLSQTRCQDRQFADLLPLSGAPELGMIHHPDFGNDFANQLSVTEKAYHRTFGNYNRHRPGDSTHVGTE